jgi:F-type H+-transporting ATPase subunit b
MEHDSILQSTTLWVFVSFVIFVVLVIWKGRPIILKTIDGRINRIRDEIKQAEALKEEATSALAEMKRTQREAIEQATSIIENAKNETKMMKKDMDARLKESMERREQQAMEKISQAKTNAIAEVKNQAVDIAIAATAQVLTSAMDGKGGDKSIDDAISALPGKLH